MCDPTPSDPRFVSYDGAQLQIEWSAPAGCGFKDDKNEGGEGGGENGSGDNGDKKESVGSGIGWFFLV